MEFKEFIGIDVSKSHLDIFMYTKGQHIRLPNTISGLDKMINWIWRLIDLTPTKVLFGFEHTGLYSLPLSLFLDEKHYCFTIIPGLQLKRSRGIVRGKNDKADAKGIAEYIYEKREKITLCQMPSTTILKLKRLLSFRERMVKERAAFKGRLKEYKSFLAPEEHKVLFDCHHQSITHLDQQIEKVEAELYKLLKEDEKLVKQFKLINTIKGVGPQTALLLIVLTGGFTQFEAWRKFASYSGVAPFPNESGTIIRKHKISHLANKRMKAILSCCACSAIKHNPEMRMYYEKRVSQGKHKMSTLNIIRNKLLARIFAVVKRETPYVEIFNYAA
ncbi:IS110 family transposase [Fulvivirga sp. M361]|uniref:IS110 family transposase n=1 Tax=Fulvivirga sp. M361 TaxID=2594266 RepID=UPI00117B1658|nr:transposase [Fulvivirga sp. M361]TRX52349.1 IS110 family transposase [Fulvivirga sp. M361]